jgi:hypothetical protein
LTVDIIVPWNFLGRLRPTGLVFTALVSTSKSKSAARGTAWFSSEHQTACAGFQHSFGSIDLDLQRNRTCFLFFGFALVA